LKSKSTVNNDFKIQVGWYYLHLNNILLNTPHHQCFGYLDSSTTVSYYVSQNNARLYVLQFYNFDLRGTEMILRR